MSRAPGPSVDIMIREFLPDGKTRVTTRWIQDGSKGWSSADNLGREHLAHGDEAAARLALAGWLRSQAEKLAPGSKLVEPPSPPAADDDDLIG